MTAERITPLEPRKFFSGIWRGTGEMLPSRLNGWFLRREEVRFESRPLWLSEVTWKVEESFEFSSGKIIERRMFAELVTFNSVRITAEDMPQGAEIILHEHGFSFTPYYILGDFAGRKWRLRCLDNNRLDEKGIIHDEVKMFYFGLPVAEMKLTVRVER